MKKLRSKRAARVRAKVSGTNERPRLSVFRSAKYIYAQIIDDEAMKTIVSVDGKVQKEKGTKLERAHALGLLLASLAKGKKIDSIVFDRGGYRYHGRVKALAEGAREGGLKF